MPIASSCSCSKNGPSEFDAQLKPLLWPPSPLGPKSAQHPCKTLSPNRHVHARPFSRTLPTKVAWTARFRLLRR